MIYTNELKKQGFKITYERVATTPDGYDVIVDISKNNSYLTCSFSMSHQRGYYFNGFEPFDFDSSGDDDIKKWNFDYEKLLCEYYGVQYLTEM